MDTLIPYTDLEKMADSVLSSGMFPAIKNRQAAITLMLLCQAEGLHPIQALKRYNIIQGQPALKADAMLAEFQRRGGTVKWIRHDHQACEAEFFAPGLAEPCRVSWTIEDGARAGLSGKTAWKMYPRQMLRARTISEGVRMSMPEPIVGLYTPEEVADFSRLEPAPARTEFEVLADTSQDADRKPLGQVIDEASLKSHEAVAQHAPATFSDSDQEAIDIAHARIEARRAQHESIFGTDDPQEEPTESFQEKLRKIEQGVAARISEQGVPKTKPGTCTKRGCDSPVDLFESSSKKFPGRAYWQCSEAHELAVKILDQGGTPKEAATATSGHYREWAFQKLLSPVASTGPKVRTTDDCPVHAERGNQLPGREIHE